MRLYFFRHGIAHDADENTPDAKRQLTDEGIKHTRHAARVLKSLGVKPKQIYSSPLTRAQETASIIGRMLGKDVQIRNELAPGFSIHAVETLIKGLGDNDEVHVRRARAGLQHDDLVAGGRARGHEERRVCARGHRHAAAAAGRTRLVDRAEDFRDGEQ